MPSPPIYQTEDYDSGGSLKARGTGNMLEDALSKLGLWPAHAARSTWDQGQCVGLIEDPQVTLWAG